MTARSHRALRRAALAAYTATSALLVWSVAATGAWPIAALVALLLAGIEVLVWRATRPRRVPDAELLAVATAVGVTRTGRHALIEPSDTPTTLLRQVKP